MSDHMMTRRNDFKRYINELGGSLIVLTQQWQSNPYGFFPTALAFNGGTDFEDVSTFPSIREISPDSTDRNLDHVYWHGWITGPQNYAGVFQVLVGQARQTPHT